LIATGDRPVGPRADEQIADRLFIIRARHQRHSDWEQLVGRLADVALIVLREAGGAPCLNLIRRKTARAQHTTVDNRRAAHRANAAVDASEDLVEHLAE